MVSAPLVVLARVTASRSDSTPSPPSMTSAVVVTTIAGLTVAPAGVATIAGAAPTSSPTAPMPATSRLRLFTSARLLLSLVDRLSVVADDVDDDIGRSVLVLEVDGAAGADLDRDE